MKTCQILLPLFFQCHRLLLSAPRFSLLHLSCRSQSIAPQPVPLVSCALLLLLFILMSPPRFPPPLLFPPVPMFPFQSLLLLLFLFRSLWPIQIRPRPLSSTPSLLTPLSTPSSHEIISLLSGRCRRPSSSIPWFMPCSGLLVCCGACFSITLFRPSLFPSTKLGGPSWWRHHCGLGTNLILILIWIPFWRACRLCTPSCCPAAHTDINWLLTVVIVSD